MMRRTKKQDFTSLDLLSSNRTYTQEVSGTGSKRFSTLDSKRVSAQKKKERRKRFFMRFLVFLFLVVALLLFLRSKYFEIKDIKVEGMNYYSGSEIISMSGAELGRNLIFDPGKCP